MNHDFILEKIQKLVKENISCPELIPLLERHKCLYLRHLTGDAKVNMDIQLGQKQPPQHVIRYARLFLQKSIKFPMLPSKGRSISGRIRFSFFPGIR